MCFPHTALPTTPLYGRTATAGGDSKQARVEARVRLQVGARAAICYGNPSQILCAYLEAFIPLGR